MANLTFEQTDRDNAHIIEMSMYIDHLEGSYGGGAVNYTRQKIDEEVGYHLIRWLRKNGFPTILVEAEHVDATVETPIERLSLTVRLEKNEDE